MCLFSCSSSSSAIKWYSSWFRRSWPERDEKGTEKINDDSRKTITYGHDNVDDLGIIRVNWKSVAGEKDKQSTAYGLFLVSGKKKEKSVLSAWQALASRFSVDLVWIDSFLRHTWTTRTNFRRFLQRSFDELGWPNLWWNAAYAKLRRCIPTLVSSRVRRVRCSSSVTLRARRYEPPLSRRNADRASRNHRDAFSTAIVRWISTRVMPVRTVDGRNVWTVACRLKCSGEVHRETSEQINYNKWDTWPK